MSIVLISPESKNYFWISFNLQIGILKMHIKITRTKERGILKLWTSGRCRWVSDLASVSLSDNYESHCQVIVVRKEYLLHR